MLEEEAFFGGEQGVGAADEGAEGGGHLQGDEEEDADPDSHGAGAFGAGAFEHFHEEAGAEEDGDEPGGDDEEAEEGFGFGRLREDPEHGSESEEEGAGESEGGDEALHDFHQLERGSGEGGEDVEARQANHGAEENAEECFEWSSPELFVEGEGSEGDSKKHEAGNNDNAEFANESARIVVVSDLVDERERILQEMLEEREQGGIIFKRWIRGWRSQWWRCLSGFLVFRCIHDKDGVGFRRSLMRGR